LIGYLDLENQDIQSEICRGYFVTGPKFQAAIKLLAERPGKTPDYGLTGEIRKMI